MAHHAYYIVGSREAALTAARAFAAEYLHTKNAHSSGAVELSFGLFSVDDARRLIDSANLSGTGGKKVIIASMSRIFHEAQNALLKVLEEPPAGVVIILCVPADGVFLATLRSRLLPLPYGPAKDKGTDTAQAHAASQLAVEFLAAPSPEREKIVAKLVERSKADKDEVKQEARREAIELLEGITVAAYAALSKVTDAPRKASLRTLLEELSGFAPVLYDRSAPLKLIFEHLLIVIPKELDAV